MPVRCLHILSVMGRWCFAAVQYPIFNRRPVGKNGKFAYTSNTGSNNISSYRVGRDGTLTLLATVAASTGAAPIDMALRGNSKFLYVLNATARSIDVFRVDRTNGQLAPVTSVSGLPAGANGLVAR